MKNKLSYKTNLKISQIKMINSLREVINQNKMILRRKIKIQSQT